MAIKTVVDGPPGVRIDVYNDSTTPATVRQVGVYAKKMHARFGPSPTEFTAEGEVTAQWTLLDHPILLGAYETRPFHGDVPNIDQFGIHADYPLRPYAEDGRGRRYWAPAVPIVRLVVGPNPPLDGQPDDLRALFEPLDHLLHPEQVEPRWKLWKPKDQRKPSAYRPPGA